MRPPRERAWRVSEPSIPVYEPWVTDADARAVAGAVAAGRLAMGPELGSLEARFARACGALEGVAVSNGTVALELALRALGVGPGDEVICPSLTIVSCAIAIERVGATPVLVDVDPSSWIVTRAHVEEALSPRTRAVLGVHLFGHPFDPAIRALASERGIALVEDAAEAHGSEVLLGGWRPCGSLGDVATFSFYANKAITCGEGGMCLTSRPELAARLRSLRNLCFVPERRFLHHELGLNARLGNVSAALALSQLDRLPAVLAHKHRVYAAYRERLAELAEVRLQVVAPWARPVPWMAALALGDGAADAETIMAELARRGIETRPFFLGLHDQPALAHHPRRPLPVTERLARRGLYLPSSPRLDEASIDRVCEALRAALGRPRSAPAARPERGSALEGAARGPRAPLEDGAEAPFRETYAGLYDLFYADKPYDDEVAALLALAERHGRAPRSVLDLGCGTGRHLAAFAARGLEVAGCDPAPAMLARARARAPRAELASARADEVRLDRRFDLVTMLFAVLSYVIDDDEIVRTLRNVREHLAPSGLFLADVWYGPAVLQQPPEAREAIAIAGPEHARRRASARLDPVRQLAYVDYELEHISSDAPARLGTEAHVLRYFFPRELAALLRAAGLELVALGTSPEGAPLPAMPRSYSALVVARAS